jgi:hypothetical protein
MEKILYRQKRAWYTLALHRVMVFVREFADCGHSGNGTTAVTRFF